MTNTINWAEKVAQGRANAIGVPWTEEQALARSQGIPAEYVREGILTKEDFEAKRKEEDRVVAEGGELDLTRLTVKDLKTKADSLGLTYTPNVVKAALIEIINNKLKEEVDTEDKSDEDSDKGDSDDKLKAGDSESKKDDE